MEKDSQGLVPAQRLRDNGDVFGFHELEDETAVVASHVIRRVLKQSTLEPPKTLACKRRRSPPSFMMALISSSMACTPYRAEPKAFRSASGSMKWFMPPMRACGSKRHAATHDPRPAEISVGAAAATYSPAMMP